MGDDSSKILDAFGRMGQRMSASGSAEYAAFISYSHTDERVARWLHRELEAYVAPKDLVGTPGNFGPIPSRFGRVFRDRDEFAGGGNLKHEIESALARSRALIVICSPAARDSTYVNAEIEYFCRAKPYAPVIPLIAQGDPSSCFPPALTTMSERVAADLRRKADGKKSGFLKVVAGAWGVSFDTLVQRQRLAEIRTRRKQVALGVALLVLLSFGVGAVVESLRRGSLIEKINDYSDVSTAYAVAAMPPRGAVWSAPDLRVVAALRADAWKAAIGRLKAEVNILTVDFSRPGLVIAGLSDGRGLVWDISSGSTISLESNRSCEEREDTVWNDCAVFAIAGSEADGFVAVGNGRGHVGIFFPTGALNRWVNIGDRAVTDMKVDHQRRELTVTTSDNKITTIADLPPPSGAPPAPVRRYPSAAKPVVVLPSLPKGPVEISEANVGYYQPSDKSFVIADTSFRNVWDGRLYVSFGPLFETWHKLSDDTNPNYWIAPPFVIYLQDDAVIALDVRLMREAVDYMTGPNPSLQDMCLTGLAQALFENSRSMATEREAVTLESLQDPCARRGLLGLADSAYR